MASRGSNDIQRVSIGSRDKRTISRGSTEIWRLIIPAWSAWVETPGTRMGGVVTETTLSRGMESGGDVTETLTNTGNNQGGGTSESRISIGGNTGGGVTETRTNIGSVSGGTVSETRTNIGSESGGVESNNVVTCDPWDPPTAPSTQEFIDQTRTCTETYDLSAVTRTDTYRIDTSAEVRTDTYRIDTAAVTRTDRYRITTAAVTRTDTYQVDTTAVVRTDNIQIDTTAITADETRMCIEDGAVVDVLNCPLDANDRDTTRNVIVVAATSTTEDREIEVTPASSVMDDRVVTVTSSSFRDEDREVTVTSASSRTEGRQVTVTPMSSTTDDRVVTVTAASTGNTRPSTNAPDGEGVSRQIMNPNYVAPPTAATIGQISVTPRNVPADASQASEFDFTVTSVNGDGEYSVVSGVPWIDIDTGAAGTGGSGSGTWSVDLNPTTGSRNGNIELLSSDGTVLDTERITQTGIV